MAISSDSHAALRERFGDAVLFRGDAGYDEARRVWNGVIDRHPAVIVRCSTTDDVVAALAYAREHGLAIAVRGGGHNVAGTAVNDGGIVIDLSPMREVRVDLERGTATAQGGATWGDVDRATHAARPRRPRRRRLGDRHRRALARRRLLAPAPARRHDDRQPRLGRGRARRRQRRPRERGRARRTCSGRCAAGARRSAS